MEVEISQSLEFKKQNNNKGMYKITKEEKQFAIEHLTRTGKEFIESIQDLNRNQWNIRPGAGQWSIAECADHILKTELYFFMPTIQKMLSEPADAGKMAEAAGKDEISYKSMENRSYKIVGQPWEESSEDTINRETLMAEFASKRAEIIEWLKNSEDEFRVHFTSFPGLDTIDVYQFILMISGHTTRHTAQINEIKSHDFYPVANPV